MDINRLKKLSGLNERPGDRGFTPGEQEPADRLKNNRGFTPGAPEPGQEPGGRGFIPGAPQVPPMPTPDRPSRPDRPDRPMPKPDIPRRPEPFRPTTPSPGGPPVPKPDPRPGIDFPMTPPSPSDPSPLMGIAPPEGFDSWNEYYADSRSDKEKMGGPRKIPSLRDYMKMIRRS